MYKTVRTAVRIFKVGIILTVFALFITSCEEENDIGNLDNAYIESVTVINVPPYYWDNASSPDLQLKLAPKSSSEWRYLTNRIKNVEVVPEILLFDVDIKITDEDWELELIDYDDLNADDVIYRITFNPYEDAENSKIPIFYNGLLVLEFNYLIK